MTEQERLEAVKKTFGDKFIHSDIKWLIEQAEKVGKYEKALLEIANWVKGSNG